MPSPPITTTTFANINDVAPTATISCVNTATATAIATYITTTINDYCYLLLLQLLPFSTTGKSATINDCC